MHYDFTTSSSPMIVIALTSGHIEIDSTDTTNTVGVEIDGEGVIVEQRRQAIVIRPDRGSRATHDITARLTVPTTTALVLKSAHATLVHTGTLRNARLHNAAGSLTLGTVTESLVAKTGAGDIVVDEVIGSAVLQTGAGRIDLGHAVGTARLATGFGDIEVGRADAMLDLKSGSGMLTIHRASADLSVRSGAGAVDVRHFEGEHLTARNHSGDITIGLPEGLPVWRDVVTVTGTLHSTLPATGEPAKGVKHAEIRAFTRHGDVTLRPAA